MASKKKSTTKKTTTKKTTTKKPTPKKPTPKKPTPKKPTPKKPVSKTTTPKRSRSAKRSAPAEPLMPVSDVGGLTLVAEVEEGGMTAGLPMAEIPSLVAADLEIPGGDITLIDTATLGLLYSRYAAVTEYAHHLMGSIDVALIGAQYEADEVRATVLAETKDDPGNKGMSVAEKKAAADAHPNTLASKKKVALLTADQAKLRGLKDGYQVQLTALSREMSRRSDEGRMRDTRG